MGNTKNMISKELLNISFWNALQKFSPKYAFSNPVMATVWIGTLILFLQIIYYSFVGIPFHKELV